jgi:gamma-glutamyl hercynylcysteine S-oxide synthase
MAALPHSDAAARAVVADQLTMARRYTEQLLGPIADADLELQFSPLQSPLVWDLAHIAHYEELWLIRNLGSGGAVDEARDDVYDAFRHPRHERSELELLGPGEAREYAADVRRRALAALARVEPHDDPLLQDWFAYGLVVQHELQHNETMCQTLQAAERLAYPVDDGDGPAPLVDGEVYVPGGTYEIGTSTTAWAYDNEREAHEVALQPFCIDVVPVTNARFARFVAAGGEPPLYWSTDADGHWQRRRFGRLEPLPPDEPVQHVSWFQANDFAQWEGRRLPTEAEWEVAAVGSEPRHANVGRRRFRPSPAGAHADGASGFGCRQMLGDVWEWTASRFHAYPGFRPFPYPEYSEVFFGGDYRVLRGGSWATHPLIARTTFRNWDHPDRRQIFAGFRTARDA